MSKFQIGDKVRVVRVNESLCSVNIGDVFEIIHEPMEISDKEVVGLRNHKGHLRTLYVSDIEKLEPTPQDASGDLSDPPASTSKSEQRPTEDAPVTNTEAEPMESEQDSSMKLTDIQKRGIEIARMYSGQSLQDRINLIAKTFGCKTASIRTSPCTGKWRGTSDIHLDLDNGASLFIGNCKTPRAKTAKEQSMRVNGTLACYNPQILVKIQTKMIPALLKREAEDNAIAAQRGLKPYMFLSVEMNNGSDKQSSGHLGWYYITIVVDGKIFALMETGLNYDIAKGELSESRPNYFVAGALKDDEVDFVFNNVGHSSTSGLYKHHLSDSVRERAERILRGRLTPEVRYDLGYGHKGNGLTVWNKLEERAGDYVTVAHIDPDRNVVIYDKDMPDSVKAQIENVALTSNMTVSATQNEPVFRTPAQE